MPWYRGTVFVFCLPPWPRPTFPSVADLLELVREWCIVITGDEMVLVLGSGWKVVVNLLSLWSRVHVGRGGRRGGGSRNLLVARNFPCLCFAIFVRATHLWYRFFVFFFGFVEQRINWLLTTCLFFWPPGCRDPW